MIQRAKFNEQDASHMLVVTSRMFTNSENISRDGEEGIFARGAESRSMNRRLE
jgi:hypothetical protein